MKMLNFTTKLKSDDKETSSSSAEHRSGGGGGTESTANDETNDCDEYDHTQNPYDPEVRLKIRI